MKRVLISIFLINLAYSQGIQPPPPQLYGETAQNETTALPEKELSLSAKKIFADKELYKLLDIKIENYLFTINELNGLKVATYPKLLFLRNSIPIEVHKELLTKVIFEKGKIVKVLASSNDFKILQYTDNVLFLQAKKNLTVANLEIFLQVGDKKEIVELLITKFNPYLKRDRGDILYTTYYIIQPRKIEPYKVVEFFYKTHGYYPTSKVVISIAGIPYEIIPTKKQDPNVSVGNFDYIVKPLLLIN